MTFKIIINALLIIMLAVAQLAFSSSLPYPANNLRLVLIVLLYILVLVGFKEAFWWTIGSGMVLDLYSFGYFGASLAELLIVLLALSYLLNRYFTDRSIYSFLALSSVGILLQDAVRYLLSSAERFLQGAAFQLPAISFLRFEAYALLVNLLVVIILFYFINYISLSFKPVFLIRRTK